MSHPPVTGYAPVSGTDIYWESRGAGGTPLVVVHGGFGVTSMFGPVLDQLAGPRQVIAIELPGLLRRLVVVSVPCRRDGWFPGVRAGMDQISAATFAPVTQHPLYQVCRAVAPDPAAFPALVDKTGDLLRQPYDWTGEVSQLKLPVLLAYGDADSIPPAHAAEFFALLGGGLADAGWDGSGVGTSRLAILPGATHYDIFHSAQLGAVVAAFLA
jgi:pimeloyl-ACP methyl ester carboxylesterase